MAFPRMRTAAGVLVELKAQDPDTEVTLHYIRQIIHTNQVPVVEVGRKKLVDVDKVLAFLAAGTSVKEENHTTGRIRPVKV